MGNSFLYVKSWLPFKCRGFWKILEVNDSEMWLSHIDFLAWFAFDEKCFQGRHCLSGYPWAHGRGFRVPINLQVSHVPADVLSGVLYRESAF